MAIGDVHTAPEFSRSALLVIDTQVDFVDGGSSSIAGTTQVVPRIADLLTAFRVANRSIVHVIRLYQGEDVDLVRRTLIAAQSNVVGPGAEGLADRRRAARQLTRRSRTRSSDPVARPAAGTWPERNRALEASVERVLPHPTR